MIDDLPNKKWTKTSLTRLAKEFMGPTARAAVVEGRVELTAIPRGQKERVIFGWGVDWTDAAERTFLTPLLKKYAKIRGLELPSEQSQKPAETKEHETQGDDSLPRARGFDNQSAEDEQDKAGD